MIASEPVQTHLGTGNPGTGNPGTGNPGTGNPGTGNPGTGNPGTGNPGTGNPGTGNPGTGNPGTTVRAVAGHPSGRESGHGCCPRNRTGTDGRQRVGSPSCTTPPTHGSGTFAPP